MQHCDRCMQCNCCNPAVLPAPAVCLYTPKPATATASLYVHPDSCSARSPALHPAVKSQRTPRHSPHQLLCCGCCQSLPSACSSSDSAARQRVLNRQAQGCILNADYCALEAPAQHVTVCKSTGCFIEPVQAPDRHVTTLHSETLDGAAQHATVKPLTPPGLGSVPACSTWRAAGRRPTPAPAGHTSTGRLAWSECWRR
jgi:hypothetical protein